MKSNVENIVYHREYGCGNIIEYNESYSLVDFPIHGLKKIKNNFLYNETNIISAFEEDFNTYPYITLKQKYDFCKKFNINSLYINLLNSCINQHNEIYLTNEFSKYFKDTDYIFLSKQNKFCQNYLLTDNDIEVVHNLVKRHNTKILYSKLFDEYTNTEITKDIINNFINKNNLLDLDFDIDYNKIKEHNKLFSISKLTNIINNSNYVSLALKSKFYTENKLIPNGDTKFDNIVNNIIETHNSKFIKQEIENNKNIFTIEGYELDEEQKLAVISDELSSLIIASAGCGKTSMLISKVAYLLKKGISEKEILIISYTNKTVKDMENRLKKFSSIKPRTIHSFCKNEIVNDNRKCDEDLLHSIIQNINNSSNTFFGKLRKLIFNYIGLFFDIEDTLDEVADSFNNKKTILQYETRRDFETLQSIINKFEKENKTLQWIKVKSLAEAKIANFLFLNSVKYEYEKEYPYPYYGKNNTTNKSYHPDFCIHLNNGENIWLEHFGVTYDEKGNKYAKWCNEEEKYIQQMNEKIQTHRKNKTTLLQTNQSMLKNDTLLKELETQLIAQGVKLTPLSDEQIKKYVKLLLKWQKYQRFETFVERFINLFKLQDKFKTLKELHEFLNNTYINKTTRTDKFFEIIDLIYDKYNKELNNRNLIDFSDMIKKAISKLENNEYLPKYKYIIVDEFQDINQSTFKLLKLLQEKSNAKIFCVGDDWQSIYGFAGSDISLFMSFNEFPYAVSSFRLNNTYRNSKELLSIAGKFIEKNPLQIHKEPKSNISNLYPIKVSNYHYCKTNKYNKNVCKNPTEALEVIMRDIYKRNKNDLSLTILGRYNNDLNTILSDNTKFTVCDSKNNVKKILYDNKDIKFQINFMSIHKAKGLEFNNVVLFLQEGENISSFPSGYTDDYLIEHLLYKKDDFNNAEERRIFYVALTRCKKQCYIINSEANPSSFYNEIKENITNINDTLDKYCKNTNQEICPICHSGIYSKHSKNNSNETFWACDNINCSAISNNKGLGKCPECGGILIERKNKSNKKTFIGCSNYPKCRYIINSKKENEL